MWWGAESQKELRYAANSRSYSAYSWIGHVTPVTPGLFISGVCLNRCGACLGWAIARTCGKIDDRTLSKEEKAFVRRMAVQCVWDGEKTSAVTESYGLGRKTIFGWLRKVEEQGLDALAPRLHTGRKHELTQEKEQEVARWVTGGDPRQYGFDFGL